MIHTITTTLKLKKKLSGTIYEFRYTAPEGFEFKPGQFVGLKLGNYPLRAYSIAGLENGEIILIIELITKSGYFLTTKEGDQMTLMGPYGVFFVKETDFPKVFISTGTGVAPFIPMVNNFLEKNPNRNIHFFFGTRYKNSDFGKQYFTHIDRMNYVHCISRSEESNPDINDVLYPQDDFKSGRVTKIVPEADLDFINSEFYICGSNEMINEMSAILREKGAGKIYVEKFGPAL